MTEWTLAHPWMTFFVAMTLAEGIAVGIKRLCWPRRKRARHG